MRFRSRDLFGRKKIGHFKRFFYMEFTQIPVFIASSVIIHSVSDIRIFLNFCKKNPLTDCMQSIRLNKNHIPLAYGISIKNFCKSLILYALSKLFFGNLALKTIIQKCIVFGINYIPHLRLSVLPFFFQSVII